MAAAVSLLVLAAAGVAPTWAVVGNRWRVAVLAPLAGAVVASVAGTLALTVGGEILPWFVGIAVLASLGALGLGWRPRVRFSEDSEDAWPTTLRIGGGVGGLLVFGATTWSLLPIRVPSVGWDARAIWLLRASWFSGNHAFLNASFRDNVELLAHSSYPPLVSTAVAVGWEVTGVHSDRLGVAIVALLNACAAVALGWVVVEAGVGAQRLRSASNGVGSSLVVGVLCGPLLVLAAFGVTGQFATDGYADPLWSFAAAAAVGYGLLLPFDRHGLASAAILIAVAGLTKQEGVPTAMVLVVLVVARSLGHLAQGHDGDESPPVRSRILGLAKKGGVRWVAAGVIGLALLSAWPLLAHVLHAPKDVNTDGPHMGTFGYRAHLTYDSMRAHLHVLVFAAPLAFVGGVFFRGRRRATGLGNDLWSWAAIATGILVVGGAYATGGGVTEFWLLSSVDRTTIFPDVMAWLVVGVWAVAVTGDPPRTMRQKGEDATSDSESTSVDTGSESRSTEVSSEVGVS